MAELIVRCDGAVGRVVISNPARLNAMTLEMWEALPPAIEALERDPAVRVIVLEGDGERAFVSGADISQFGERRGDPASQARYGAAAAAAYLAPERCSKPVVARIRGICFGGGLGLAAACDIRFCSADARFRMPAGRLGLGYAPAGLRRFLAVLGHQNTLDVFLSARVFDAADALRMGFVASVHPVDAFDAAVDAWCEATARNAPLTLRAVKLAVAQWHRDPGERDLAAAEAAVAACFASEDYREGARAFMEKRPPRFQGR